jgi:ATP-dependent DNA helicase RecQ
MISREKALDTLRNGLGKQDGAFREGQWEAIVQLVNARGRVLCVQRTGWGKSMVYFVAAKLMREQGLGPTLIISPLLALMRNQVEAAVRLNLRAERIDSTNATEWRAVRERLLNDEIDILLISPERLANDDFVANTLLPIAGRIGLLVIDEAHCISDWGHDFRPDYRRIGQVLRRLPQNIAVLATTATANHRVVDDVQVQLGGVVTLQRGALIRNSLVLQTVTLNSPAERLAWLADHLPGLPGTGIVYTLTTRDADRVAEWLRHNGLNAQSYHGGKTDQERQDLETALLNNEIQCLVATTALGMGYDKPDLGYVVHYQTPGSVVFYYQQVGRAGRAIDKAYGVLLSGHEEDDINAFFRASAFPPEWQISRILNALEESEEGMTVRELERAVNLRQSQIEKVLKLLVVEDAAPVVKIDAKWSRTAHNFILDRERIEYLTHQREQEWAQMKQYIGSTTCLMQFLASALDDEMAAACGKCAVCAGEPPVSTRLSKERLIAAQRFVRHSEMVLEPKKQWDIGALTESSRKYGWSKLNIPVHLRAEEGRVLSRWGEPVWGQLVRDGKAAGHFDDDLVAASVELICQRWPFACAPTWIACVPSTRHPTLVKDFARRVAAALDLPLHIVIVKTREAEPQKGMENRFHQCHNLDGVFAIETGAADVSGPVLLIDDVTDSGWTMALTAALLRQAGSGAIYPYALATTAAK